MGRFVERYYEYIKSAANIIKSNIKYFEDVPEEELEEIIKVKRRFSKEL